MVGMPTQILTGTREYRDDLRARQTSSNREVTLWVLSLVYFPIVAGVVWAWLHDYGFIGYWLSIAAVQTAGLFVVLSLMLAHSIVRVRQDSQPETATKP